MHWTPAKVRLLFYPLWLFSSFILITLLGGFIAGEIDPLEWDAEGRGMLVTLWLFTAIFTTLPLEVNDGPQALAKTLNGDDQ